jgi:glycosyltransferase involved in cell wall biosynthesis
MITLSVIIPVYNEAATFVQLMEQVLAVKIPNVELEIVLVESGSTDGTTDLVKQYETKKHVKIFYQEKPQGKGNALKLAFKHVTGDIVLIQDADLEYKPGEYGKLIQPIIDGKTSFVLGSRPLGKESWNIRKYKGYFFYARLLNFGGLAYTTLFNLLYGVWLTDPATMFKVFKRECIEGIRWRSDYFDLDWEIVAKLIRKGYKPLEIPISYMSRSTAEGKKIRFLRDGFLVFLAIVRFRFFD